MENVFYVAEIVKKFCVVELITFVASRVCYIEGSFPTQGL